LIQTLKIRAAWLLLAGLVVILGTACGLLSAPSVADKPSASASPTLLPPPKPFSSPEAGDAPTASRPSPSPTDPAVPPTRIPPPDLNPAAKPGTAASGERARVVNTEGQGANIRAEPSPTGALVRTVREGTELELIGAEREGGGRRWRNVRDPASGASGWIVSDLLAALPAPALAAPAASPAPEAKPAGEPKPVGEPKPAAEPKPGASPAAPASAGAAKPTQRIGDADRAYLTVLQTQVDALGKAITAANEQIERAGGRPDTVSDPTWQKDTQAVAKSLSDAAASIRAATPGPNTGEVHRFASNAADRADEAADGLRSAIETRDARALNGVRTTLVRLLAEINNMNLSLLQLQ
jgi:hypothetical protein